MIKVKDIMTKTSYRFTPDDDIFRVIEMFYELNLEGGLVFRNDELDGLFTEKDLIKGVALKKKKLKDIYQKVEKSVLEEEIITMINDSDCTIYPVRSTDNIWTGYLTKSNLIDAKLHQIETDELSFNAIFEFAHNGILSIDNKGYITAMNPAAEKMTRLKKEEAIGKFLADVGIPVGLLDVVRTGKQATNKYYVGRRKFISNRTPIFKQGKVVGAVGVFQDISEIEKMSNELQTVKQLIQDFHSIIDFSSEAMLILDKYGELVKANQAFKRMIGLDELPQYYQQLVGEYVDHCIISAIEKEKRSVSFIDKNKKNGNLLCIRAAPLHYYEKIVVSIKNRSSDKREHHQLYSKSYELHELFSDFKKKHIFCTQSSIMKKLKKNILNVSNSELPILIEGEVGTGKERIARIIHSYHTVKDEPFVKINCSSTANPPETFEENLRNNKNMGKCTYYFHEVNKLSADEQIILLNFLRSLQKDSHIIVSSSENLLSLVEEENFLADLYEVLNGILLTVPALRDRAEDIPLMVSVFQDKFSNLYKVEKFFSEEAIECLQSYHWPGNIIELMNVVEWLMTTDTEVIINKKEVENALFQQHIASLPPSNVTVKEIMPLKEAIEEVEKQLITKTMKLYRNTRSSASVLGINQSTVVRKMQKYSKEEHSHLG